MKKRFTEEQIIGFLREAEAALPPRNWLRARKSAEETFSNSLEALLARTPSRQ